MWIKTIVKKCTWFVLNFKAKYVVTIYINSYSVFFINQGYIYIFFLYSYKAPEEKQYVGMHCIMFKINLNFKGFDFVAKL